MSLVSSSFWLMKNGTLMLLNVQTVPRMIAGVRTGRSSGSVIARNDWRLVAPSISAAS